MLVVVADLVAEVTEHRPVRLAEPHPQRLAVVVKGFDEVDRDHASCMSDGHLLAGAVAGQQVERQAAVAAPERVDRQPDVVELVDETAQRPRRGHQLLARQRVISVGLAADQRVRQAPPPFVG